MQKITFDLPGVYADLHDVQRRLTRLTEKHGPGAVVVQPRGRHHAVRVRLDDPETIWPLLLHARALADDIGRATAPAARVAVARITSALHTHYAETFPIGQPVETPDGQQGVTRISIVATGVFIHTHADGTAHTWTASNLLEYKARQAIQRDLMAS